MLTVSPLPIDRASLARFCERHHIRRISVFGSTLRGTAGPDSDIDLLVELEPGMEPRAHRHRDHGGRAVRPARRQARRAAHARDLSPYFREDVLREAELQLAR